MNEVEHLLQQSRSAKPRRALRADFTTNVINRLASYTRPSRFVRLQETIRMKLFTKPAFAVIGIVALTTTASAYAAVGGWPGVEALFRGEHRLPNGDRIVQVDTQNCTMLSAFGVTKQAKPLSSVYYKVKAESKLTNEQMTRMVRGECYLAEHADFSQKTIMPILNANPANKDRVVGGYADTTVKQVSATSIALEQTMAVVPAGGTVPTLTFNHIAPDVLVYDGVQKITMNDIHVGDHVSIQYRASGDALTRSEELAPEKINPDEQVVVSISKNSPDLGVAIEYRLQNGREFENFEQVIPCSTQPSGFCTYSETQQR